MEKKGCLKCKACTSNFEREDFLNVLGRDKLEKLEN